MESFCMALRRLPLLSFAAILLFCWNVGAAIPVEEVPTFQLRAKISDSQKVAQDSVHTFSMGSSSATSTGTAWSAWIRFTTNDAANAIAPHSYPNNYMSSFPVVLYLGVAPVTNITSIEAEVKMDGRRDTELLQAKLFGGILGVLLWRDADKVAHASTMAQYNRRYWASLATVHIKAEEYPKSFPFVDRFIGGDADLLDCQEGIRNLAAAGFSGIMLPPDKRQRDILLTTGLRRTAWAVYNPPGYAFDHDTNVTDVAIRDWADSQAKPYLDAGYEKKDMAVFAMSDEPGWYYPSAFGPLTNNPAAMNRFHSYLEAQGLSPRDLGATTWASVMPIGRSRAVDVQSKKLFYWTMRFFPWDSSRHFAKCTHALEDAFYTNMPIIVNWNFFSGRFYVPGPVANNGDKESPDAAMGGHDWLEFGKMRGCTMLWTEDWFGDELAYQWSYYCARLRCAATEGGVNFGGYIIPRTAGGRPQGILQKILTIVGSGGKCIKYFVFGPEYNFPGNCYSENARVLPVMAEAHRMVGSAESILMPGKRPKPQVAILMPRSAQVWDAMDKKLPRMVDDATNVGLNRSTVDYMAEVYDLYLALQHANIPVDIVDEDKLVVANLKHYRVLYVTEPNIPEEGQKALVSWTKNGGTLVTVSGAATADRYDQKSRVLAAGIGLEEEPRQRLLVGDVNSLPKVGKIKTDGGEISAVGVRGKLLVYKDYIIEASFDDGSPAVVGRSFGRGKIVHFAWMPGLSYVCTPNEKQDGLPVGWSEAIRKLIVGPAVMAGAAQPVTVDRPMIETPILVSDKGAAVTLLNWSGKDVPSLKVSVKTALTVNQVRSVTRGIIPFERSGSDIFFALPLSAADIVVLTP